MFLYWEQGSRDGTPTGRIWVEHGNTVMFSNLVVVDDIERRTGLGLSDGRSFDGVAAQRIRLALTEKTTQAMMPTAAAPELAHANTFRR
ncbi:hypothetical protein [Rhodococcus ruber]